MTIGNYAMTKRKIAGGFAMTVIDIKSGGHEKWHPLQLSLYVAGKPDPEILFREEDHTYWYKGRELVSVTHALNPEKNPFYKPGSAERGHSVHRMAVLDAQGVLDKSTVGDGFAGYFCAWRAFCKEMVSSFGTFEEIVGDPEIGYAGRRDLTLNLKAQLFPGAILYLNKKGTYKLEPYDVMQMRALVAEAKRKVVEYRQHAALRMF